VTAFLIVYGTIALFAGIITALDLLADWRRRRAQKH